MKTASDYIWYLKFKITNLEKELDAYRSGNKIKKLQHDYEAVIREKDREIQKWKKEAARAHAQAVTVRKYWSEIFDDLERGKKRELQKAMAETKRIEQRALAAEKKNVELEEKLKEKRREKYALGEELEKALGLNQKLTAQVNMDFTNSSIPSSMQGAGRKKIVNSRTLSGKRRGAQPGHKGAGRKKHQPDRIVSLPDPDFCGNDPDYYKTDKTLSRQLVEIHITVRTTEYRADVWRNRTTGTRVHAPFPDGVVNDVNYGGTVKAAAFLLGNECNVSHHKIKKFLSEATGGELELSIGMINGLCEEFSEKTKAKKAEIIKKLMTSPAMNVDFTNANVDGKSAQALILASEQNQAVLYIARKHKGHKGIQGTPLENYAGTVVHDHDTTFYSYGLRHQECNQHNIRYAIGSTENEPEREWGGKMLGLLREMLHYRNTLGENELDEGIVKRFEERYDAILDLGDEEYLDTPPSDYYREGYNLCKRLRKYKESELLFLHDKNVPANNSLCERLARVFKRKQKQLMAFRSFENLMWLCDSLSIVYSLRQEGENVYEAVSDIYRRKREISKAKRKQQLKEEVTGE